MLIVFAIFGRGALIRARLATLVLFIAAGVAAALFIPNTLHWRSRNPYMQSVQEIANYEEGSGRAQRSGRNRARTELEEPLESNETNSEAPK